MISKTALFLFASICFWHCKPETMKTSSSLEPDKDLEMYLQETFFYYELMKNQPSVLRDSIYLAVAAELRLKYNLDSNKLAKFDELTGPSSPAYSQMLDSIKARLKKFELQ